MPARQQQAQPADPSHSVMALPIYHEHPYVTPSATSQGHHHHMAGNGSPITVPSPPPESVEAPALVRKYLQHRKALSTIQHRLARCFLDVNPLKVQDIESIIEKLRHTKCSEAFLFSRLVTKYQDANSSYLRQQFHDALCAGELLKWIEEAAGVPGLYETAKSQPSLLDVLRDGQVLCKIAGVQHREIPSMAGLGSADRHPSDEHNGSPTPSDASPKPLPPAAGTPSSSPTGPFYFDASENIHRFLYFATETLRWNHLAGAGDKLFETADLLDARNDPLVVSRLLWVSMRMYTEGLCECPPPLIAILDFGSFFVNGNSLRDVFPPPDVSGAIEALQASIVGDAALGPVVQTMLTYNTSKHAIELSHPVEQPQPIEFPVAVCEKIIVVRAFGLFEILGRVVQHYIERWDGVRWRFKLVDPETNAIARIAESTEPESPLTSQVRASRRDPQQMPMLQPPQVNSGNSSANASFANIAQATGATGSQSSNTPVMELHIPPPPVSPVRKLSRAPTPPAASFSTRSGSPPSSAMGAMRPPLMPSLIHSAIPSSEATPAQTPVPTPLRNSKHSSSTPHNSNLSAHHLMPHFSSGSHLGVGSKSQSLDINFQPPSMNSSFAGAPPHGSATPGTGSHTRRMLVSNSRAPESQERDGLEVLSRQSTDSALGTQTASDSSSMMLQIPSALSTEPSLAPSRATVAAGPVSAEPSIIGTTTSSRSGAAGTTLGTPLTRQTSSAVLTTFGSLLLEPEEVSDAESFDIEFEHRDTNEITSIVRVAPGAPGVLVGRGAYGSVFVGIDLRTGRSVAVKVIPLQHAAGAPQTEEYRLRLTAAEREVDMLSSFTHQNIISCIGACITQAQTLCIAMEFASGGTLLSMLEKFAPIPVMLAHKHIREIANGLLYLHSQGVIHRDLKTENILLRGDGTVAIADFGCSQSVAKVAMGSKLVGTVKYMAPEVLNREEYSVKSDVWAFGCCVVELCLGMPPWFESGRTLDVQLMWYIANTDEKPFTEEHLSHLEPSIRNLVSSCLERDPLSRPTLGDAMRKFERDAL